MKCIRCGQREEDMVLVLTRGGWICAECVHNLAVRSGDAETCRTCRSYDLDTVAGVWAHCNVHNHNKRFNDYCVQYRRRDG
jgi:hypothetical protein